MTLADLITLFREEAFDTAEPYLWSSTVLKLHANEAEQEACRRSELITDSTSAFCTPSFTAGDPIVPLDPLITEVKRVRAAGQYVQLQQISALEMDRKRPGWEFHTGTIPLCVVTGYETGKLRLYPNPTVGGSLSMTVARLPKADMTADADTPEIRKEYHPALVQWMLYRAYSKQDTQAADPLKAEKALVNFEREFGRRQSARNETWRRERYETHIDPLA